MLWLLVALPALAAVMTFAAAAPTPHRAGGLPGRIAVGGVLATAIAGLAAVATAAGPLDWVWGSGLRVRLAAEGFGRVMIILVPTIAVAVVAYATADREERGRPRLLALLLTFTAAMELLVLANDFLLLLIAWELVGACSWALIAHRWRDRGRPRSALQAFLTTRVGDLGLYLAAAATFAATGSLDFAALGAVRGPALDVIAAGILFAAAAKSAQVPFAPWLFSAMAGPTAASALLHSATMVAAGAYALIRLAPALEPTGWLLPTVTAIGLVTTFAAGAVALLQRDLKKVLAGSTASQYGLMFVAVGTGSTAAAGAHLVTHAAFKSLLFLGAGIAIHAAGAGDLSRLRLGTTLPRVARTFAVGALALAAVPPLGGAYSKEAVVSAAASRAYWLGLIVLASGAVTALYAARLYLLAFGPGERRDVLGPTAMERGSVWALAFISLVLGLFWVPAVDRAVGIAAGGSLVNGSLWEFAQSLVLIAAGLAGAVLLWRRGALLSLGLNQRTQDWIAGWYDLPRAAQTIVVGPTCAAARALARFDDRVVDAGVRGAAWIGRGFAGLFSGWGERGIDGIVRATARAAAALAVRSGTIDDGAIDATVERTASAAGWAGSVVRRLQTGLSHQYYLIVAAGLVAAVVVAILGR